MQQKLQIWNSIFNLGKAIAPVFAATACVLHLTSSYLRNRSFKTLRAVAAGLTVAIVPFTVIFMESTNQKMIDGAIGSPINEDAATLLARWTTLNLIRSALPLAGGAVGLWCLKTDASS